MVFFFKQKTAYEIYQCDWSSDVCSSDLAYGKYDRLEFFIQKELHLPSRIVITKSDGLESRDRKSVV